MENSSVPFRAFLGAILSVVKGKAVEASVFNREMELDTINEEEEEESPSTPDADDGSKRKNPHPPPMPTMAQGNIRVLVKSQLGLVQPPVQATALLLPVRKPR